MQISQLLKVQIQKFLCLSYREFPEFSRTHLTLICKSIFNASRSVQTKRTCYLTGLVNRRIRLKEPKSIYKSFNPPGKKSCMSLSILQNTPCGNSFDSSQNIGLKRKVSKEDFTNVRMILMPGFKFSWNFTGSNNEKFKNSPIFLYIYR